MMSKRVRGSTTGHAGRSFLPVSSTLSGHMYLWVHDRPYPNVVESRWLGLLGVSQISLEKQQQHTVHGLLGKYSITHRYSAHLATTATYSTWATREVQYYTPVQCPPNATTATYSTWATREVQYYTLVQCPPSNNSNIQYMGY